MSVLVCVCVGGGGWERETRVLAPYVKSWNWKSKICLCLKIKAWNSFALKFHSNWKSATKAGSFLIKTSYPSSYQLLFKGSLVLLSVNLFCCWPLLPKLVGTGFANKAVTLKRTTPTHTLNKGWNDRTYIRLDTATHKALRPHVKS